MDLELTDDQLVLRDNIRSVLSAHCPPSTVRAIYERRDDAVALWATMVELGWPALAIGESAGGLGLGFVELALMAEELGHASAPGPLLATATQFAPLLSELAALPILAEVAHGRRTGSLALAERGRWDLAAMTTEAEPAGTGWQVTGAKSAVLAGSLVDSFAVVAREPSSGRLGVFLVDRHEVTATDTGALDPALALADLHFDRTPAVLVGVPGPATERAIERAAQEATVAMALHMVGACRRIFELTLEYAKVREQYDRVIGSFQALKHRFAELFLSVERATAVCYFAATAIAEDDPRRAEATHLAKATAGDCQRLLAEDGLQLHGGIGFTWDNDLHFLLKRSKAGELLCGSSGWHRNALAIHLGLIPEAVA